jgi:hypothetical protein
MIGETLGHSHHVRMLEKDEAAISVVIGERAERFRPQCHLGVEFERAVEHGSAEVEA